MDVYTLSTFKLKQLTMNVADKLILDNVASVRATCFRENTPQRIFKSHGDLSTLFELLSTFLRSKYRIVISFTEDIVLFIMLGWLDKLLAFVYINHDPDNPVSHQLQGGQLTTYYNFQLTQCY